MEVLGTIETAMRIARKSVDPTNTFMEAYFSEEIYECVTIWHALIKDNHTHRQRITFSH